jgi:hypothetical protein
LERTAAVAFAYEPPPTTRAIRQAEFLRDVEEQRVIGGAADALDYLTIKHALVVVMTQDCDLERDCDLRFPDEGEPPPAEEVEVDANSLAQILLCDAYSDTELRGKLTNFGSKDWKRVVQNENERYHHFDAAEIEDGTGTPVDAVCIDFRKHFTVPSVYVYDRVAAKDTVRIAIVPPIYSHDLMHRFYGYLSRVALPP